MNWKQRCAKLLSVFFTGYGGGFAVIIPANYLYFPELINWYMIFTLPVISGLIMLFPQLGKMFGEMANGN